MASLIDFLKPTPLGTVLELRVTRYLRDRTLRIKITANQDNPDCLRSGLLIHYFYRIVRQYAVSDGRDSLCLYFAFTR